LKLVLAIGLPASLGLVLLAKPLTALLFQHGAFDAADVRQTADMTAAYGIAVWAYCGLLIVHRGYYALGDRTTPLRIGLWTAGLNLVLNLTLIWFVGGVGLAAGTSLTATLQVIVATWLLQQRVGRFGRGDLLGALLRTLAATAIMGAACAVTLYLLPRGTTLVARGTAVAAPMLAAIVAYFTAARWLGINEVWLLFSRRRDRTAV
jgi:putative peptidoglycan lipid II flippase